MSHARPRRRIALIALTVVLALVLTSCFGEDEGTADSTTTTAQASPPQTVAPTTQAPPPQTVAPTTQAPPPTVTPTTQAPPPQTVPVTTAPTEPSVDGDGILLYTVQAGDTLFSIAQRFGVSLDDVIEANNISNPDVIYEGDTLTIPPAG